MNTEFKDIANSLLNLCRISSDDKVDASDTLWLAKKIQIEMDLIESNITMSEYNKLTEDLQSPFVSQL